MAKHRNFDRVKRLHWRFRSVFQKRHTVEHGDILPCNVSGFCSKLS